MKKILISLTLVLLLCGCKEEKEYSCIFKDERTDDMKSYVRVTLTSEDDIVKNERLYAVYKFKDAKSAEDGYSTIEEVFKQDISVKIEQKEERIIAQGEKDVSEMKYELEGKVSYYEQLGYTCK